MSTALQKKKKNQLSLLTENMTSFEYTSGQAAGNATSAFKFCAESFQLYATRTNNARSLKVEAVANNTGFGTCSRAFLWLLLCYPLACSYLNNVLAQSLEIVWQRDPIAHYPIVLPANKKITNKQPLTTWKNTSRKCKRVSRWIKRETMATAPRDTMAGRRTTRAVLYEEGSLGKNQEGNRRPSNRAPFLPRLFTFVSIVVKALKWASSNQQTIAVLGQVLSFVLFLSFR